jgi:hypothetical protein
MIIVIMWVSITACRGHTVYISPSVGQIWLAKSILKIQEKWEANSVLLEECMASCPCEPEVTGPSWACWRSKSWVWHG